MDNYDKNKLKNLLNKDNNFKRLLSTILEKGIQIQKFWIDPEIDNDWFVGLWSHTIKSIWTMEREKLLISFWKRREDEEGRDYKVSSFEETINLLLKEVDASSASNTVDDYDLLFVDNLDEFVVSSLEIYNILNEDVVFLAKKAKEDNIS